MGDALLFQFIFAASAGKLKDDGRFQNSAAKNRAKSKIARRNFHGFALGFFFARLASSRW